MEKKVFKVSGMKCAGCKAKVENALNALHGVAEVEANLAEKSVEIAYDSSLLNEEELKQAVDSAGHFELEITQ